CSSSSSSGAPAPTRSSQKYSPRSRRASIFVPSIRSRTSTPPTVDAGQDGLRVRSGGLADQLALGELAGGGGLTRVHGGVRRVLGLDWAAGDEDGRQQRAEQGDRGAEPQPVAQGGDEGLLDGVRDLPGH